ncbi:MAG TPA: nucleotide synthetase [Allosphingosinicella sp.]|nr:nucleotide synthetase [Allosphingosinicella sp.]
MARNDPDGGAPISAAAPLNLEMRQIWDGDPPKRYLIRVIDIEEVRTSGGPELRASFRDPDKEPRKLPAGGIEQAIRDAARKAGPKRAFVSRARLVIARTKAFLKGKGPLRSPLDIALYGDPTIIVFILARPINLRFSPLAKALTHKNPADRDGYGGLMHVRLANGKYYARPEPLEDCRIVYFVAKPPPGPSKEPPPGYRYKHGLNLNVRLDHPPDDDDDKTPRALDIMIDPDIRYPGQ